MLLLLLLPATLSLSIELFRTVDSRYRTRQIIGGQSFDLVLSFDTNLLMVLDSSSDTCFNLDSCYNKDSSKSSKSITQNSENCWSTVQISSTSECAYKYKSDWNYTNEGALSSDTILVGSTTIKDLVFGRILKESESLKAGGILGLGPSNLDELYGTSLIETLINDEGTHSVLGICVDGNKGFLHVGGFDSRYNLNNFAVYPQVFNDRYSVSLSSVKIGGKSIAVDLDARLNPGSDFLLFPYKIIKQMISELSSFYQTSCQQALCEEDGHVFFGHSLIRPPSEYPEIILNIQGFEIRLRGFLKKCGTEHYCSVIRSSSDHVVIGSAVLEELYLVIDMENSKLALAKRKECRESDDLIVIYEWEQHFFAVIFKLFMVFSSLIMIVVIGWRCGKSYELEFEIISGDDD